MYNGSREIPYVPSSLKRKVKFPKRSSFYSYLMTRTERYFRMTRQSPSDSVQLYCKAIILLGLLAASYIMLVFYATTWWQTGVYSIALGLSMASIGFCIQHDGNHGSFSRRPWVNKLAAMTLDLLGGSSYLWDKKHNQAHHTFTNIHEHDDDINVGIWGRLAPEQPRRWYHRFQHIYLWFIYGFLVPKWHFVDDFANVIRGRIGSHHFPRPKGKDLAVFIGGKIIFFTLAFGVPIFIAHHSWWTTALTYLSTCFLMSVVLAIVFQSAHVVEETAFPPPHPETQEMSDPWAEHQVLTTANFSPKNPVLTWFLGGLNFQIIHHLLPKISHIHYPAISKIVKRACKRFNLPYHVHANLFTAIRSHYRWLRKMGQPD